ncbi:MAG TPA: DUF3619 family protein [Casimicrobiaceae bacterium]|nr:DUF3619 family protein [Casimicrobiaceae bacterium]
MTQESQTARKITGYLDAATADLKAGTVYRLQQARARALAHVAEPAVETDFALAGGAGASMRGQRPRALSPASLRWLGVVLIAATMLFGWHQWRAMQEAKEIQEIDSQILSSDLPIDAYLDRGFQNWLKASFEP